MSKPREINSHNDDFNPQDLVNRLMENQKVMGAQLVRGCLVGRGCLAAISCHSLTTDFGICKQVD